MSQQQKLNTNNNNNRPPSELEIKTLIFGKREEDSDEEKKNKEQETKKIIEILGSEEDGSGSGSGSQASGDDGEGSQNGGEQGEQGDTKSVKKQKKKKKKQQKKEKKIKQMLGLDEQALDANDPTMTKTKMKQDDTQTKTQPVKEKFSNQDRLSRMEKWDEVDKNNQYNQKLMPIQDFKGIIEKRRCTNLFWLFVWVILNVGFFFCAVISFMYGVPYRLSNGNDFRGDICGVGILTDRSYQYFASATLDISVSICVTSCPQTTGQDICLYNTNGIIYPNEWQNFCYQQLASDYLGRYCMPKEPLNRQSVEAYLSTPRNTVKRLSSDLNLTLDLILIGTFMGIIIAFGLQSLMRYEQKVPYVIWGCIWGSVGCFVTIAYLFYLEYTRNLYWITLIVCGIYMLIVINLFNRINLAIGFVKASSRVVKVLNQLNVVPFFSVLVSVITGALTILACIYAMTIGEVVLVSTSSGAIDNNRAKILEYNSYTVFIILFLFYMFYNWQNFTLGINNMITSFALCIWFFAKKKDTVQIPLHITLKNIFRYHVGTVSLYILIEPIFRLPKLLMDLIQSAVRQLPQSSQFVRYIEGCFSCCLNVYNSFLRYITLHSFVQTCLFGDGYNVASKKAFFLINRHKEKLKDLDFLLCCALVIAVIIYIIISNAKTTPFLLNDLSQVETPILPAAVVFIICYQISDIFQGSFNMACKTIIQCYFIDKEMFVGEQRFVEKFIRDFMEFYAKEDLTTFKLKSQKQAVITQNIKHKDIEKAINKNYFNEFEGQKKKQEAKRKNVDDEENSDEDDDDIDNKESDSDSCIIEDDNSDSDEDNNSDDFNIGNDKTKVMDTKPVNIRPQQRKNTQGFNQSNMYINDNASSSNGDNIPLRKLDETSLRSSGASFFDAGRTKNNFTRSDNQTENLLPVSDVFMNQSQLRLGTGSSDKTKTIDLSRGGQNSRGGRFGLAKNFAKE